MTVGAAETEVIAAPALDLSTWQTAVVTGLGILLAWAFSLWRSRQKAETEHEELDATKSLWEQRNFLIDRRVIPFAMSTAEHWLFTQLPAILKDASDGDGFAWRDHYGRMRSYVRGRVLQKFASENLDILTFLTDNELDDLIDRILTRLISKLPTQVSALLPEAVVTKLASYASSFLATRAHGYIAPSAEAE